MAEAKKRLLIADDSFIDREILHHILENHLYTCVARDLENGEFDTIDELISLFKRFNK